VQRDGVWTLGPLPRSAALEDLVASRLADVSPESRAALDVLAVAGRLGLHDLDEFSTADIVADLEQDGVITVSVDDRRTDVVMAHPMYGEMLRARLPTLRYRSMQRRLAEQIARHGARRRDDTMRLAIWRLETGGDLDSQLLYDAGRLALVGRDTVLAERFAAAALNRGWAAISARRSSPRCCGRALAMSKRRRIGVDRTDLGTATSRTALTVSPTFACHAVTSTAP
jgi:hypothetical protein